MVKKGKNLLLFCMGGAGYMGLELLWRGWSHGSMFLAGGSCFLLLGRLREKLRPLALPVRGVACSAVITAVELAAGLVFNRDYGVWDYRDLPLNFRGQICLPFSLLWAPLGVAGMELYDVVERKLNAE